MADTLTKEQRTRMMGRIRGKNTQPELAVRTVLHHLGFRFRINRADLPGTPDIVLPRYRTAIFVHGCYWHRHEGCRNCTTPTDNRAFWQKKFEENVTRDRRNQNDLKKQGWVVSVIWECSVRKDPILAVTNALIDSVILDEDTPYPELSVDEIKRRVRERFESSWK